MFTNILTLVQVLPLIPSQSCMHMGTCAKGRFRACAHKGLLYKIVDRLGKVKQAIHNVFRALYLLYCLGSRLIWPLAARTSLGATAILAKFLEKKLPFQPTMFWYALNYVEPLLS